MNEEEFSFDLSKKDIENFKKTIGYDEVEAIHKRFENGTETEEDLINNIIHYKLELNVEDEKEIEADVVELKYYNKIIDLYNKEKEKIQNAKWYIHQEIVRIEEDIEDYIDDDRIGNRDIIGQLKERLKHWQDVEKLLNGKSKDDLYMDWRKYGEYE